MTDGIEIHDLKIDDVNFKIMDFAGQKDYAHTHSLFFKEGSIFLAICKPRAENINLLNNYLQMVEDFASESEIILISTRADEAKLTTQQEEIILKQHPNIKRKCISVDSVSGTNIRELKDTLVEVAKSKKDTRIKMPEAVLKLEKMLGSNPTFSISDKIFKKFAVEECKIEEKYLSVVRKLLVMWGSIYELKDGHVVLHLQQLADVLACVVSRNPDTLKRIGNVSEGILNHTEDVLESIWGSAALKKSYDAELWSLKCDPSRIPPFIELLYTAGLAFPLRDNSGELLHASLIPAMLPENPVGYEFPLSGREHDFKLFKYFTDSVSCDVDNEFNMEKTTIAWQCLPITFIAQLQVKLKSFAMIGGAWKNGCVITGKNSGSKSIAIVYEKENNLIILSKNNVSAPRTIILDAVMKLCEDRFKGMKAIDFTLTIVNQKNIRDEFSTEDIYDALKNKNGVLIARNNKVIKCNITINESLIIFLHTKECIGLLPHQSVSDIALNVQNLLKWSESKRKLSKQQKDPGGNSASQAGSNKLVKSNPKRTFPAEIENLHQLSEKFKSYEINKDYNFDQDDFKLRRTKAIIKSIPKLTEYLCTPSSPYSTFRSKALWVLMRTQQSTLMLVPMTPLDTLLGWKIVSNRSAYISIAVDVTVVSNKNDNHTEEEEHTTKIKLILEELLLVNSYPDLVFGDFEAFLGFTPIITEAIQKRMLALETHFFSDADDDIFIAKEYLSDYQGVYYFSKELFILKVYFYF